jgi:hypothetical protein
MSWWRFIRAEKNKCVTRVNLLVFADSLIVTQENEGDLQNTVRHLNDLLKAYHFKISWHTIEDLCSFPKELEHPEVAWPRGWQFEWRKPCDGEVSSFGNPCGLGTR